VLDAGSEKLGVDLAVEQLVPLPPREIPVSDLPLVPTV